MSELSTEEYVKEFMSVVDNVIVPAGRDDVKRFVDEYLSKTDFFSAPASTRFHGSVEGGLVKHSVCVYKNLCMKKKYSPYWSEALKNVSDDSIAIAALFHDVCKANVYVVDYRNKKNNDGVWERVPYYKFDDSIPLGHGEKSCILMMKTVNLKDEEIFAIRWHMGPYSGQQDWNNLSSAMTKYPLILALFESDMEDTI